MSEIKLTADSGGGTVSWKGPASTTGNAAFQLTLPVNDGDANEVLTTNGSGALTWGAAASSVCARNYITNGDMQVAQRGASFTGGGTTDISKNDDDDYTLDQWILLSDGNDIVDVTQATEVPTAGATNSIALDVETTAKKFGILQVIEGKDCKSIIGGTASLSFKMKASAVDKLDSVKAAIISWSSTVDAVTSDVVSAWGAEGTRPTLATNWTYENANSSGTTGNFTPTTSWATYTLKNVSIDTSSTTNVAVFIWSDVTDTTAGQFLYITDVQLEAGADTTDYLRKRYDDELRNCTRYLYAHIQDVHEPLSTGDKYGGANGHSIIPFINVMRANPTALIINGTSYWQYQSTGNQDEYDNISLLQSSQKAAKLYHDGNFAGGYQGYAKTAWSDNAAARLIFTAEL